MAEIKMSPQSIVLALGSNLGERFDHLQRALLGLSEYVVLKAISPVYETHPLYIEDQPNFYNAVLLGTTILEPLALLWIIKQLEIEMGRLPIYRYGPRLIDIDIIFYEHACIDLPELKIPHSRLHEREFVLRPLVDIMPDFQHPKSGKTMKELLDKLESVTARQLKQTLHNPGDNA